MSNEINPQLAFETIARIAALIANADIAVTVKEKPAAQFGGERSEKMCQKPNN